MLSITGSMPFVGFIDGLTNNIAPSVIQLPGGWIADRIGRKKPMIFGSILIILGFTVLIVRSSAVWVYYEGGLRR